MELNDIITLAIRFAVVVIVYLFTTYAKPWLKAKAAQAEDSNLYSVIVKLVAAAQQLRERGDDYTGSQLYDIVCENLVNMGIDVDETAQMYIEAAVLELHKQLNKKDDNETTYDEDIRTSSGLLTEE